MSAAPRPPRTFLTASWRRLLMLNYEVDADVLRPHLPEGVELDDWNGRTYASVVGFLFLDARLRGVPIPCHGHFEEVNLRFYVRREADDGRRRGVVFIKEVVPKRAVAIVARRFYNENYVAHPMSYDFNAPTDTTDGSIAYRWYAAGRWNQVSARFAGTSTPLLAGSEAEFIAEHYWGYSRQVDGTTVEYQVTHPSWSAWNALDARLDCDVRTFYGPRFVEALAGPPASAFVADGSPVVVFGGQRLAGRAAAAGRTR